MTRQICVRQILSASGQGFKKLNTVHHVLVVKSVVMLDSLKHSYKTHNTIVRLDLTVIHQSLAVFKLVLPVIDAQSVKTDRFHAKLDITKKIQVEKSVNFVPLEKFVIQEELKRISTL